LREYTDVFGEMGVVIHQLYVMNTEMWISRCMQSLLTQTLAFNVQILHLVMCCCFIFFLLVIICMGILCTSRLH